MSIKAILLAAATAATFLAPAAAMAQDWGHRDYDGRQDRRIERRHDDRRHWRAESYSSGYGYDAYPAYGYDAYSYVAPAWRDRDRDDRRDRDGDRDWRRHYR